MTTNRYQQARLFRTRVNNEALATRQIEDALGSLEQTLDDATARVICAATFRSVHGSLQQFAATGELVDPESALEELEGSFGNVRRLRWTTALWDYLERKITAEPARGRVRPCSDAEAAI
ncbi:hypothetical protein [Subtercola frigoramans]|uniref:Uncharacterized protein n=1 Tax=Subtercola frigoramans TaxID=120298 RepID=A0ABS2L623_9MICO|nr:hypothetical protein [Subtercola frigoramans]MBM7472503.1 hypothetical protein [Subtercola frigoramans]